MQRRDWQLRVQDILEAVEHIQRYTQGLTFEQFAADDLRIDAVSRNFIIIGEATAHISPEIRTRHPEIPWVDMRGMRNVVTHGYFAVNLNILWQTISDDLEPLVPMLQRMLEQEDGAG